MNFNRIKSESGFAALLALIMVGMLTLIGLAAMSTSDDEVTIAGNELQDMRSFYGAEAGLEAAMAFIQANYDTTGAPPAVLPSGHIVANGCAVDYKTSSDQPAELKSLTNGTMSGLIGMVKPYTVVATGVSDIDNAKVVLSQTFEAAEVPIFQYAVFYNNNLELSPGSDMTLIGRVHSNGNLYVQAGSKLNMDSYVTASGHVIHGPNGPHPLVNGDVDMKDPEGNYVTMKESGIDWLDSQDSYWYDESVARWGGRVQDSTHGQSSLHMALKSTIDPHKLIEPASGGNTDSYENKAGLKIVNGSAYTLVGGIWVDVTVNLVAAGALSFANDQFIDQRQTDAKVDVAELDIDKLYSSGYAPSNGIVYYSQKVTGGNYPALRLRNGSELDSSLTIASENPVYTLGDFNSVTPRPAAILADAVTFLSNSWDDNYSDSNYTKRSATATTVNASIVTGDIPTTATEYSGGFENLVRFLEDWDGEKMTWSGSMARLWTSQQATDPYTRLGFPYYSDPTRIWTYNIGLDDPANHPPGAPCFRIFQRTGWKQEYVGDVKPVPAS